MFSRNILEFENGCTVGQGGSIRPPSSYKVQFSDIDVDSKRSTSGYLSRNRVRGGATAARTITVSWTKLTYPELVELIAAGNAAKFQLTFLSPSSVNGFDTATVYRDANMEYELVNIFSDEEAYWTTTMSFVEF